jgi:hypothetical protein
MNVSALFSPLRRLRRGQQATILLMCALFLVLSTLAGGTYRMNNGDGWRILRSAMVENQDSYQSHRPYPQYFQFLPLSAVKPGDFVPFSSAAAVTETAALIQRGLGFQRYNTLWVCWFYLALYLSGLTGILLRGHKLAGGALLVLLLNPYILSYFNSPFEDSLLIALIPLLAFFAFEKNTLGYLGSQWAGLLVTASKVQFLPFFLIGLRRTTWRRNAAVILIGVLCVGALMFKSSKFAVPNGYNRYFNGLAYSMASVSSWDAVDFKARAKVAPTVVRADQVQLPAGTAQYWGTSFWPEGNALPEAQLDDMSRHFRSWYWSTIFANPQYAYRVVTEPLLTALKADYRIEYLFQSSLPPALLAPYSLLTRHLGPVSLLATLCSLALALYTRQLRFVLYNLFLLGYPILAVYGDGYYELEKHLFPVTLLGLVFPLTHLIYGTTAVTSISTRARSSINATT